MREPGQVQQAMEATLDDAKRFFVWAQRTTSDRTAVVQIVVFGEGLTEQDRRLGHRFGVARENLVLGLEDWDRLRGDAGLSNAL